MRLNLNAFIIVVSGTLLVNSCKKEPDSPPENVLNTSKIITIDSLRSWQQSASPGTVTIADSLNLYAIVTMDESQGNIYKALYIQDHTGAISMQMASAGNFVVGDSLRISLYGAVLSEYGGVIQLDSIDPATDIVLQSQGNDLQPIVKSVTDITPDDEARLVKLTQVQFLYAELTGTYADPVNQLSVNHMLEDCSGNMIIVRTSGIANFAGDDLAQGNGSIVCIVNRFDTEIQLIIRDIDEVKMTGDRCAGELLTTEALLPAGGQPGQSLALLTGLSEQRAQARIMPTFQITTQAAAAMKQQRHG